MKIWKTFIKWMSEFNIGIGFTVFFIGYGLLIIFRNTLNLEDSPFFSKKYDVILVLLFFLFLSFGMFIKREVRGIKGIPAIVISILFILGLIFVIAQMLIYGKIIY